MARSLVIVESPAKAKTINKYLGRNYTVKASYGHVMDLPKKTIGILLPGARKRQEKEEAQDQGKPAHKLGKKVVKPVTVNGREHLRADLRSDPGQDQGDPRSAESRPRRGSHLPGGRPGPRGRSHLRAPGGNPGQAQEVRGPWSPKPRKARTAIQAAKPAAKKEAPDQWQWRASKNLSRDVQRDHAESDQGRVRASLRK